MKLLLKNGQPVPELLELAKIFEMQHDGTARGLNEALQKNWYQEGKFRFQINGGNNDKAVSAMRLIFGLGMVEAVGPPSLTAHYDYCLLLRATVVAVRKRLAFLLQLYQRGLKFNKLVLLGSTRPLDLIKEGLAALTTPAELPFKFGWSLENQPTTEFGMMKMVVEQSVLPPEWSFCFVEAAPVPDFKQKRFRAANTEETIRAWLKKSGATFGKCLAVTSQPFVGHQRLAVLRGLDEQRNSFKVDACGYAAPQNTAVEIFLDNIAKQLYEEVRLLPA